MSLAAQIQCASDPPHMRLVALGAVALLHLLCLPTACHPGPWQLLSGWFCSRLSTWLFLLPAAGTPVPDIPPQASVVSCCLKSSISALFWCTRPGLGLPFSPISPAPQGLLTDHSSFPAWTLLSYLFGSCWSLAGSCLSSLFIYFYQFLKGQCKWEFLYKNPFSSPRLESITPSTKAPAFCCLGCCDNAHLILPCGRVSCL